MDDACGGFARPAACGASALIIVLLLVGVLSVIAGSLLLSATARYHTTFQSASWQESIVGAEAGIDLAMNELRKRVMQGPSTSFGANWTTVAPSGTAYANYGHAFPAGGSLPYTLSTHTGEGNRVMQTRVFVDVPGSSGTPAANFAIPPDTSNATFISQLDNPNLRDPDGVDRSRWWFRVRALGTAGLSGPPVANLQKLDNQLRRFSFYTDWRTGLSVSSPQVSRLVEVTAQPLTNFRNALMADKRIDLSNQDVLIDSYDSSKGGYSATTNHGQMGNIATNGQLINANHATVNGNAMTDNGSVNAGDNVSGQQSNNFYQELTPVAANMLNPAWSGVPDGGLVTTNTTYTASTDIANPTLVRLDGINLSAGGNVISLAAPDNATSGTPSFIKIYVQGDIFTYSDSCISIDAGVSAIIYFTGSVGLQGDGVFNNSLLASHLVLNGIRPPANADGTYPLRTINVATNEDFEGVIYAPNHDLTLALTAAAASSGGGSSGSSGPSSVSGQIFNLRVQVTNLNAEIANLQIDYANNMADYNNNGNQSSYAHAKNDEKSIAKDQQKVATLNNQIAALLGNSTASQADDHARGYNGIYGGFVARTIKVSNKTHVHYDETLRQAGPVNHYQIVSWFEDNLGRDAAGGAEQYWWTSASK